LYRPDRGRLTFAGADLVRLSPHRIARAGLGRTFQNTEVFRALSALDNVLVGAHASLHGGVLAAACGLAAGGREESAARPRAAALPRGPTRAEATPREGGGDAVAIEAYRGSASRVAWAARSVLVVRAPARRRGGDRRAPNPDLLARSRGRRRRSGGGRRPWARGRRLPSRRVRDASARRRAAVPAGGGRRRGPRGGGR